ncbi:MAG TPA: triose-phosphate isomerase [Geobacteraceae bacterium]|nr:triose-phosphate isomerase [Geobacteraceae bacterium]
MRKPVIAGNWKLYKTSQEAVDFVTSLIPMVKDITDVEIIIAPVFTVLDTVRKTLKDSGLKLAAQNCFWEDEGAYTGEVSPKMLTDAGCTYVIIGHSERRQYFAETDETINKKIKAALKGGLVPIFCAGETLVEREAGETLAVLRKQIAGGLSGISAADVDRTIIAYEPVWAIGTGKTATINQAQEAHKFIRDLLSELYGQAVSDKIRILYGGSVKPENVSGLMSQSDIDGALVGGASLKAESFASIVRFKE